MDKRTRNLYMLHSIEFRLWPVGAIYGGDATKYGPLIRGPEWAAAINSAFHYQRGHGGGTLYICDHRNGAITEMI